MKERSKLIGYLRGEIVGPALPLSEPEIVEFHDGVFTDTNASRRGALAWRPATGTPLEEVLYYDRESPHRKYGTGLLHPEGTRTTPPEEEAAKATDTLGAELQDTEIEATSSDPESGENAGGATALDGSDPTSDDFEVTSPDVRHPSTMGLTFCCHVPADGAVVVQLPRSRHFPWQENDARPFPVNGRYEECKRRINIDGRAPAKGPAWRRLPAFAEGTLVTVSGGELATGKPISRRISMPEGSPITLTVDLYPRVLANAADRYLVTVVLRNRKQASSEGNREATLFQAYFEVTVKGGALERYPESQRPFVQLDPEEQSLLLLYRESATWAVGHGCAAAWDSGPGESPSFLYADVLPTVETPSMTPDIADAEGQQIRLRMRDLATLPDDGSGDAWAALRSLVAEYEAWIDRRRQDAEALSDALRPVALRHLEDCAECLQRIRRGLALLEADADVRTAFCLANRSMLLQQIATKRLAKRPLTWDRAKGRVVPAGVGTSPWSIFEAQGEGNKLGYWRAFQIAFLLMQLEGMSDGSSPEREIVDLIWFPTGGGKTEAYLGVMAFYMFHQRLLIRSAGNSPARDGTNVLMRYTLRMLTTQQFQRAASLICAMEYLRRHPEHAGQVSVPGSRFSLGLWIGGDGTPNKVRDAAREVNAFRMKKVEGNPLVITECPWCRAEIGRYEPPKGPARLAGITELKDEGPRLHCSDATCEFGREQVASWLPVEVIDEQIYQAAPSMVVATADKLAMLAYRPVAGALFGRRRTSDEVSQERLPPGLIVQDELHLIAGPLGTIYGLYEGVFERLCSFEAENQVIRPKIIASTATIRGAADQTRALYARIRPGGDEANVRLFPSPGLTMGDSFFGVYARRPDGLLESGRLYLGIHASEYGSVLTTQVRTFSAALCRAGSFVSDLRDPWWTLLVFYNSLRELGGAKTLFDSDIRSRLKFLLNRERVPESERRRLRSAEELTSRLSQAEIVGMMDLLSTEYTPGEGNRAPDACLASSIIEVGVDIDRLSLMGVVGQPKTTAQYIQVTGRVGRRWMDRPGLILMLYSPAKSRDRSHYEQFHSYHRRLYERVEPTSATPFAISAVQRALAGALITWARQQVNADVSDWNAYRKEVLRGFELLKERCGIVQEPSDAARSLEEMERVCTDLLNRWSANPQKFEEFPPSPDGEYLMLWPGQYATALQKRRGVVVPSSLRQVDGSAELIITEAYASLVRGGPSAAYEE